MPRDMFHSVIEAQSIYPAAYATAQIGAFADLQGFDGALVLVHVGDYTSGNAAITLDESDNGVSARDGGFDLDGTSAAKGADGRVIVAKVDGVAVAPKVDSADTIVAIGYTGTARYIRVNVAAAEATYGAVVIKGFPRYAPTR